jgi:TPR repeat protein
LIILYIIGSSLSLAEVKNTEMQIIYKLLQEKKFKESIQKLEVLSNKNNLNAQLLISKIFLTGDLTPQDFENSYFWASSALLGGLKKSQKILKKLDGYLTEKQINEIKEKLRTFLEKRAIDNDKRAIVQIAKLYENYLDQPDMINAYTWYNIAVAQGIKSAKTKRDQILNELSEKDLLEAQSLSIKLFKQINN